MGSKFGNIVVWNVSAVFIFVQPKRLITAKSPKADTAIGIRT